MNKETVISVATIVDHFSLDLINYLRQTSDVLSQHFYYYEIILIARNNLISDIVSLKKSISMLPKIRVIELANQCDDDIAYSAALNSAIGDAIVLMDFQSDAVELILSMINKILHEKCDVVVCQNTAKNKEPFWINWLSAFFYKCASLLCDRSVDFDRTHFSCYSRTAVNFILQYKNNIRNLRLLRQLLGLKTTHLEYESISTQKKNAKSTFRLLFTRIEEIFHLSVKPLRIVSAAGFILGSVNFFYIGYIILVKMFGNHVIPGWASLSLTQSIVFLVLFFSISIIASYLNIISQEIQKRPLYTITNEWFSENAQYNLSQKNVVEN